MPGKPMRCSTAAGSTPAIPANVANGELFVTGRVKDMIIRGGRHYFPYELEDTVGRMPGVVRGGVAVCGARDERSGTEQVVIIA
jgi:fatty-acyl-CoA synthase